MIREVGAQSAVREKKTCPGEFRIRWILCYRGGGGKGWGLWGKFPVRKKSLHTSRSWTGIVVNIKRSNLAGKGGLGV